MSQSSDVHEMSPAIRAADAADVMAVALRLGVGLPAGVERQSAEALDAVARNLRDGEGHDSPEAVDAILSIVPAPARGIMRLAAAGGDARQLLGFLERIVLLDRRHRWESVLAACYPIGISLCAVAGIAVLSVVQDPLLNSLAEPIQLAVPTAEPVPTPVWDAVALPAGIAAASLAAVAVIWGSQRQRRAEASRRKAAVACELESICEGMGLEGSRREEILDDLKGVTGGISAPVFPPLATVLKKQPAADRGAALASVAGFYRDTSDALLERRVKMLPVVGSIVAGVAVLLYGVALFTPLARLFDTIASMPVAPPWSPGS
jgi:hypothetical protein